MAAQRLLYVTADGLLESLGFSQVVRVIERLSAMGHRYSVLSLEKPRDLERRSRVAEVTRRLAASGIEWHHVAYDWSGSAGAARANLQALISTATSLAKTGAFRGLHARSYHGALVGWLVRAATGVPYLFDTRSYWIDERIEEGRWFTTPIRTAVGRGVERALYSGAAGFVTLTQLHAEDLRRGAQGPLRGRPAVCIPTCADYDDFTRRPASRCTAVPEAIRAQLAGGLVLGLVGSINRSYLVDASFELCRRVMTARADAKVLVLSAQREEYLTRMAACGIDTSRVIVTKAEHDAMPQWLSLMDWGLLLLQPSSLAKRASMPTKLAEFFAAGVRPVQFGCNTEVTDWVTVAGSGFAMRSVDEAGQVEAAAHLATAPRLPAQLEHARAVTAGHFSLESGVRRYDAVLRELFG